ncbi:MAG TPA: hypothetical protein VF691_07860 [Cytophagaceae bacterium]|jgi:hypothetical protein
MFAPPPKINIIAINSMNPEKLIEFYWEFGILFNKERNESGQLFYSYTYDALRFEIYEVFKIEDTSKNLAVTFFIDTIEPYLENLKLKGYKEIVVIWIKDNLQYTRLNDPDGHTIQLVTQVTAIKST